MNHCHLSQTNERNWEILQLNACFLQSNSQLNNRTPSSWLSEDECGFALSMFTENITSSSPLSIYTLILTARNICGKRTRRTSNPLSQFRWRYVTFALSQNPEKPALIDHLVLLPLRIVYIDKYMDMKGGLGKGGMNWEIGIDIYTLQAKCIK